MSSAKPTVAGAKTQQGSGYTLELQISPDQLTAKVRITKAQRTAACTAADVVAFVKGAGLSLGKADDERLHTVAEKLAACSGTVTEAVCHGVAAKPWPAVEWFVPLGAHHHEDQGRGSVDLHQVTRFANASAGQRLCALPAPPAAGHDVFGHALPAAPAPVKAGKNVGADPGDPHVLVSQREGCARLVEGVLSVEEQLEIKGDLDFKVGNIDFWGAVVIHGNVPDDFQVKATRNIVIEGSVGMCTIHAGSDILIKGGVSGARKAKLSCGGNLSARFLHGAHVDAGRDVSVEVECHDSVVHAGGDIKVVRGGLIGGEARAAGNVEAALIGSELCVPTAVSSGHAGAVPGHAKGHLADLAEADELVGKTAAELAHLAPPGSKQLSAVQKERQASLQAHLAQAQEKVHRARRDLAEIAREHGGGKQTVIKAAKAVFPRVSVSVGGVYTLAVQSELKGPVTFSADPEKAGVKVEARKANQELVERPEGAEDRADRWRWGPMVLLAGLVPSLMLSWAPGTRLLAQAGPLRVAGCEVVDNYLASARARVRDAKGQTLDLGPEELAHPEECVATGTLVEKRRWSFDYQYNGAPFGWPKGATRYLGPLGVLLSILAWGVSLAGKRLALRRGAAKQG